MNTRLLVVLAVTVSCFLGGALLLSTVARSETEEITEELQEIGVDSIPTQLTELGEGNRRAEARHTEGHAQARSETFSGTWEGTLSELPFQLKIWAVDGKPGSIEWNATIQFQGRDIENLLALAWHERKYCFYRPSDLSFISMFVKDGRMILAYAEGDTVRVIKLKKAT